MQDAFITINGNDMLSREIADYPGGIVIPLDKPYMWTSADAVRKIKFRAQRHFFKKNLKVGHAGTLDPLATGLLLICIGNATKLAEQFQASDKEYVADIVFGATTPSYDLEKDIDREYPSAHITAQAVADILPSFTGEQEQIAPLFSAKSIDGTRAYEIARKMLRNGDTASVSAAREAGIRTSLIRINELELLDFFSTAEIPGTPGQAGNPGSAGTHRTITVKKYSHDLPCARLRISCSKGTYIRALARDIGEALGSGAHLASLRRTRSGQFNIADSVTMDTALHVFNEDREDRNNFF